MNYYSPGFLLSITVKLHLLPARSFTQATQLNLLPALFVCCSVYLSCFMVAYCMSAGVVTQILKFAPSSIPKDSPCFSLSMRWWLLKHFCNFCWWIYVFYHNQTVFLFCLSVSCSLHWRFWIGYTLQKLCIKRSSCTRVWPTFLKSWMCN